MTRFLDGPAAGQTLRLQRAPLMLRVTRDRNGRWDALDQPEDTPLPDETIYVYRRTGEPGSCHINAGKASGWFSMGQYEYWHGHAPSHYLAITTAWKAWATLHMNTPTPPTPCP